MDSKPDKPKRKYRKRLKPEKKFELFLEAAREDSVNAEILRREGLYASDLQRIRRTVREGALKELARSQKRGPTEEERRIAELEKQLQEKDSLIAQLSMERMILGKKVNGE
jgi:transposase-like protein